MSLRTARPACVYLTVRPWTSIWPRLGQQSWAWGLSMTRSGPPLPPDFLGIGSSDGRSMNLNTRSTERIWEGQRERVRRAVSHWEWPSINTVYYCPLLSCWGRNISETISKLVWWTSNFSVTSWLFYNHRAPLLLVLNGRINHDWLLKVFTLFVSCCTWVSVCTYMKQRTISSLLS